MFWRIQAWRSLAKSRIYEKIRRHVTCIYLYNSVDRNDTDEKEKVDDERRLKRKGRFERKWNLGRVLNLFCANVLELCSTEVESFVLIESSYSVDFALQFGKAWNRIFVGREFCNTFVLIRDSGLCLL